MQPEQDQPVQSTPPDPAPNNITPEKPKGLPKWLWFVIAGAIVFFVAGIWLLTSLIMSNSKSNPQSKNNGQSTHLTELKVGSRPYVYPCAVATEADYARIFALDDTAVGTVSEMSALPAKDIQAKTSDLTKLAPALSDTYDASCSYTLAKKNASRVNRIDIQIAQSTDEKEMLEDFKNKRSLDSGDLTYDNVDNGTELLGKLPSFPKTSYVKLPKADSPLPSLKAILVSGTYLMTLQYGLGDGETTDTTLPRLDEYARAIQTKLNSYKNGKPVNLTGRDTFVGKKFIDICQQTDLARLASQLGDVQFRPDQASYSSTYGSLAGSRASQDGAISSCDLGFNTPGDREAQSAIGQNQAENNNSEERSLSSQASDGPSADSIWPHSLGITVNTFRTADEAKATLAAKKQRAAAPTPGGGEPSIEDIVGVGDAAYKYHRESAQDTMFNAEEAQVVTLDDILVVAAGNDVITISVTQSSEAIDYQTSPIEVNENQLKNVFKLLKETLANR